MQKKRLYYKVWYFCNDHIKYNKCEEIKIENIDKNIYKNYKNKKR